MITDSNTGVFVGQSECAAGAVQGKLARFAALLVFACLALTHVAAPTITYVQGNYATPQISQASGERPGYLYSSRDRGGPERRGGGLKRHHRHGEFGYRQQGKQLYTGAVGPTHQRNAVAVHLLRQEYCSGSGRSEHGYGRIF